MIQWEEIVKTLDDIFIGLDEMGVLEGDDYTTWQEVRQKYISTIYDGVE